MANALKLLKLKPTGFQLLQEVPIDAPPARVWKAILDADSWFKMDWERAAGVELTLEPRVGGRFMSERRDGSESRFFGTVAHLEPQKLLRIIGPMGMTHLPVTSSMIWELGPKKGGKATMLRFCHRAYGMMTPDAKKQYSHGWKLFLAQLKTLAEKKEKKK